MTQILSDARRLIAEGRAAFGSGDVSVLLGDAARFVEVITHGTCSGFLDASAQARIAQYQRARAAMC